MKRPWSRYTDRVVHLIAYHRNKVCYSLITMTGIVPGPHSHSATLGLLSPHHEYVVKLELLVQTNLLVQCST